MQERNANLVLYALAAAALAAGILARFKGLAAAPLAVDEYYLLRSSDNIVASGWPRFACGGWYTRGLILQYLVASLRHAGLSAELAPRLVCAISSVGMLPAAYLLGRHVYGRTVGVLTVAVLALSVWEIEMARFGRMYAPFQAVFLWYLVFFFRYTLERDSRAGAWMIGLTVLGTLVWEGGVFLAIANFLPSLLRQSQGRLPQARDWVRLAGAALLLAAVYFFVTADVRHTADPPFPVEYVAPAQALSPDFLHAVEMRPSALLAHPVWLVLCLVPLGAAIVALRWIWSWRHRPLTAVGLMAALVAALAHQFLAVVAVLLLLLLLRHASLKELFDRRAASFHLAIASSALLWTAFAFAVLDGRTNVDGDTFRGILVVVYQLASFPDVADVVALPWAKAVPVLGALLLALLGIAIVRNLTDAEARRPGEQALLVVVLCLLLAVGLTHPPRHETRYAFFLYPALWLIAIGTVADMLSRVTERQTAATATLVIVALGGFALTEDFRPRHLLRIDSPAEIFRRGMAPGYASHLIVREDTREIARWLTRHASHEGDLVISGYHSLDYYYPRVSYFYSNLHDRIFPELACHAATVDRWSNLPLLYTAAALESKLSTHSRTFLVLFRDRAEKVMSVLAAWQPRIAWSSDLITIVTVASPNTRQRPELSSHGRVARPPSPDGWTHRPQSESDP